MDYSSIGYFDNWESQLEEWADLHDEDCGSLNKDPEGCNCTMQGIKPFFRKVNWYKRQKLLKDIETALVGRIQIMPPNPSYSEGIHDAIKILRGQEGEL